MENVRLTHGERVMYTRSIRLRIARIVSLMPRCGSRTADGISARIIVFMLTICLSFGSLSFAFAHGVVHAIEIPANFEPSPSIPGALKLAQLLYRHGRSLFTEDQYTTMGDIYGLLSSEIDEEAPDATTDDHAERGRRRAYGEHLLVQLLHDLGRTIRVDVRGERPQMDLQAVTRLLSDAGIVVLQIDDGEGPIRFHIRDIDLDVQSAELRPPEPIPYVTGGTTWALLLVRYASEGQTLIPLNFQETAAGAMSVPDKQLEYPEYGSWFAWGEDDRFKMGMITISVPPKGTLKLTVLDEKRAPTPALVRLTSLIDQGPYEIHDAVEWLLNRDRAKIDLQLKRPPNAVDLSPLFPFFHGWPTTTRDDPQFMNLRGDFGGVYWCVPGPFDVMMPAGPWEVRIYRGLEYEPIVDVVEIKPGETLELTYQTRRWVNMAERGWYGGDHHIHARIMSNDDARRLMSWVKAVDLHVANVLLMGDQFKTNFEQRGFGPEYRVKDGDNVIVPGQEDPRYWRGHAIGLNLTALTRFEDRYVLNDLVADAIHEQGGLYGLAHLITEDHDIERDATLLVPRGKVDFGEIMQFGGLGTRLYYDFLDLGFPLTASAGSDTPFFSGVGDVRVYAHVGDGPFSADAWFDAMRRGRTFVTTGPMVEFRINDAFPGDTVRVESGETVRLRVRAWGLKGASAPERIKVIRNSDLIRETPSSDEDAESIEDEFDLRPGYGAWVAVHVYGRDGSEAHTTPIYLIREGFRFWNVGRAEELIKARLTTIAEMEAELAQLEGQARNGRTPVTDMLWANVLTNADALRERFRNSRGVFEGLQQLLTQELRDRTSSDANTGIN